MPEQHDDKDAGYYEELVERLMLDTRSDTAIRCAALRMFPIDRNRVPKAKGDVPTELDFIDVFLNQKHLVGSRGRSSSFVDFMRKVPRLDMASPNGYPYLQRLEKQKCIEAQISAAKSAKTVLKPNGIVTMIKEYPDEKFAAEWDFDPKTSMVVDFRSRWTDPPKNYITKHFVFEEKDGIYRLVQMSFEEYPTSWFPYRKSGLTSIEWRKFNEDISFPTEDAIKNHEGKYALLFLQEPQNPKSKK